MGEADRIYALMRGSEMNDWVGGADPEQAGMFNHWTLGRAATLDRDSHVLDLGCGNGRVALRLLAHDTPPARLLGIDIVPRLVEFCQREIAAAFPAASFDLVEGSNDHYERFKTDARPKSREQIVAENPQGFTVAYAFSVFTHIAPEDFAGLLRFAGDLLRPGAELLFTAFTLTPFSRAMIAHDRGTYAMAAAQYREDGQVLVADPADPLALIAYDRDRIEAYVREAGLVLTKCEYGNWMGSGLTGPLQDVYVARKPDAALARDLGLTV